MSGCGAGHYLRSLRRALGDKFDYTGIDITPHHLSLAKRAFSKDVRAHFEHADLFDLKYPDKRFDIRDLHEPDAKSSEHR